ncbi:MAG: N-formylglutamate amidohydrolase [Elusimicrobiota bacterium]
MADVIWRLVSGPGPVVATAIHDGHAVRPEIAQRLALGEGDRLREEDPFTGRWTTAAPARIVALRSRFEVDLNRPRENAVYRGPQDAWGLRVWRCPLPQSAAAGSLAEYDGFYAMLRALYTRKLRRHKRLVVLDLHSYNHRRGGPDAPPADPAGNPQVNVGTGTMVRERWSPLVDRFMGDMAAFAFPGGRLDVRENVKFQGGHLARWTHENFARSICVLSVEFKKFFMDEWTGIPDKSMIAAVGKALRAAVPGLLTELRRS